MFIVFGAILAYLVQSVFGNVLPFTAPLFFLMIGLAIKFTDASVINKEEVCLVKSNDFAKQNVEEDILSKKGDN